jgi:hypothetical protein
LRSRRKRTTRGRKEAATTRERKMRGQRGSGLGQGGGREEEGRAALTGDEESEKESVGEEGIPALVGNM